MASRESVCEWVAMSFTVNCELARRKAGWVIASAAIYDTCRGAGHPPAVPPDDARLPDEGRREEGGAGLGLQDQPAHAALVVLLGRPSAWLTGGRGRG